MAAASRPRFTLRLSDSCGDSMAAVCSVSVCTGWAGSDMSRTYTPVVRSAPVRTYGAFVGKRTAVS